jgi:hypothetical protein
MTVGVWPPKDILGEEFLGCWGTGEKSGRLMRGIELWWCGQTDGAVWGIIVWLQESSRRALKPVLRVPNRQVSRAKASRMNIAKTIIVIENVCDEMRRSSCGRMVRKLSMEVATSSHTPSRCLRRRSHPRQPTARTDS